MRRGVFGARSRLAVGGACGAAIGLAFVATAYAYVRSRTETTMTPIFWQSSCAFLVPDRAGSTDLTMPALLQVVDKSIGNFGRIMKRLVGCERQLSVQLNEGGAQLGIGQAYCNERVRLFV